MAKREIQLNVFLHEDLQDIDEELLYIQYFDWLTDTISRISGRVMDVKFIKPADAPTLCKYDYKTDDMQSLMDSFYKTLVDYLDEKPDVYYSGDYLHRYLLLTRDNINKRILGIAQSPGIFGIASITSKTTAAHEVGHMLDARHEDSADQVDTYYGSFKSIMTPISGGQAFVFSDKNQENIRNFLNTLN